MMNKTPSLMTSSDLYLVRDPLNLTSLCPTEVLLEVCEGRASKSHLDLGRAWSLIGYSPWGPKELDTTEQLHFYFHGPDTCAKL